MSTTTSATGIPIPGTPAYWAVQREAVALVDAWQHTELGADDELALLRRIAAHGFASRMMAAHGANVARWVAILETLRVVFEDDGDENDDPDSDGPPHGEDWCRNGCQPLFGMECGMCGYEGRGVRIDQVATVAEHCCHCNARTHQSPDGICELCGKDAEDAGDTPAASGPAPGARPDPDRHAHLPAADTRDTPNGPGPAPCEPGRAGGER